jgi:hypothetical protein
MIECDAFQYSRIGGISSRQKDGQYKENDE